MSRLAAAFPAFSFKKVPRDSAGPLQANSSVHFGPNVNLLVVLLVISQAEGGDVCAVQSGGA